MAYLALTAGQVDADSPLDSTLFGQIKDNFDAHEAEKLERDGTILMTGNLNMGTNDITNIGDVGADTVTLSAGGGTGIDLNDKEFTTTGDGTVNNLTVNGNLTGPNFVMGDAFTTTNGVTTSSGTGVLTDNSADSIDFTYLAANNFVVRVTSDSENSLFPIDAITDADNLDLSDNTGLGKNSFAVSNAATYAIYEVANISDTQVGSISFTSGETGNKTFSFSSSQAGVNRRGIRIRTSASGSSDTFILTYGDANYGSAVGSALHGNDYYLYAANGANNITISKNGTNAAATFDIFVEDMRQIEVV